MDVSIHPLTHPTQSFAGMLDPSSLAATPTEGRYIFTTLRYDDVLRHQIENTAAADGAQSPVYLLSAHHRRLCCAASALFGDNASAIMEQAGLATSNDLEKVVTRAVIGSSPTSKATEAQASATRVRLQCHAQGRLKITCGSLSPSPTALLFPHLLEHDVDSHVSWRVVLDTSATTKTVNTQHKTNHRVDYDRARRNAGIDSLAVLKEVILYNHDGHVIDASITTPYFWRDGKWLTPSAELGGQQGTTRSWALHQELCDEGLVHHSSLRPGEVVWLSNAARGFFMGTFTHD